MNHYSDEKMRTTEAHHTVWLDPSDIMLSKNKPTSKGYILHEEHNILENHRAGETD